MGDPATGSTEDPSSTVPFVSGRGLPGCTQHRLVCILRRAAIDAFDLPAAPQITFERSAEFSALPTGGSHEAGMIVPAVSPPENALHELGHRSRNRPNFMRIVGRSFLQTAVSHTDWGGVDQPNRRIHVSNGAGDDHYSNKSLPRHEDSSGSDSGSTPTRNGLAVNRCPERHHVPSTRHHTARRYRAKTAHDATPSSLSEKSGCRGVKGMMGRASNQWSRR